MGSKIRPGSRPSLGQYAQRNPDLQPRIPGPGHTLALAAGMAAGSFVIRWIFLWLRQVALSPTPYTTPPIGPAQVDPRRRRIVLSDLHMGGGDRLDDFEDDQALIGFLDHYAGPGEPTELILAGDTVEFLQVRLPDLPDDEYTDRAAALRLDTIIKAHAGVFAALARFIADPRHQLTVLIGNHDFELHFPAAKARLATALGLPPGDPRLRFGVSYHGGGAYIVHGNQFDGWNRFIHFDGISEPFEVVRGTQLIKEVINELEEDPLLIAPLIDNVKPTSAFFWYLVALPRLRSAPSRRFLARGVAGFFQVMAWPTPHQMPITGRGPGGILSAPPMGGLWHQVARFRRGRVARQRELSRQVGEVAGAVEPPHEVIDQVQSEAARQVEREQAAFNDRFAREMLAIARRPEHRDDTIFVCGHTHLARVVPLGNGQVYVNTGTWTEIIYDIATMRAQEQRFPFLEITYPGGSHPRGRLLVWVGTNEAPAPWRDGHKLVRKGRSPLRSSTG
ncbi:MAG: UDP-2,3-diacylglucosamine diphosphatase [Chloroflexales bacterium]|nr:UDP-2,3-diacylglucosamine diphosphatase [Chloroflexales bacterium]